jgi:soluble lytic murein transglycosylase
MNTRRKTHSALALVAALALCACQLAESSPGAAEPERTLAREAAPTVTLDEAFFRPFFSEEGAPAGLKGAWERFTRQDRRGAREQLEGFLKKSPAHAQAARARFFLAWLEREDGAHAAAAARFAQVAEEYPLLEDHARYWGAQSAFEARDYDATARLCLKISLGSQFGAKSMYLRGRALLRQEQHEAAVEVLERFLELYPSAPYGGDVRNSLAIAYEGAGRWKDAGRAWHALRIDYPGRALEKEAEAGVKRAQKKLGAEDQRAVLAWKPADRLRRARALYELHRSEQVVSDLNELLSEKGMKPGEGLWCDATFLQAQAWRKLRKHTEASSGYARFLEHCPRHEEVVEALFSGGRSLWTIDQDKRAVAWFERLWTDFAHHSYADDAMLYAARIAASRKDSQEEERLLKAQVETFPRGDMLADAHWRRFLLHYERGDYEGAVAYADEIAHATGESSLYDRGRMAYFRARALEEQGEARAAVQGYEGVLARAPMSYYALLALNRIKALDEDALTRLLAEITRARGGGGEWTIEPPQLAQDSRFQRGVELLRLGLFEAAQDEFGGLKRQYPKEERLLWTLALLFDRAGAYHLSHNIPRRQIGEFGTAWPVGEDRTLYELAFPRPFHKEVSQRAKERGIPEALAYAIMREESGFNARIESWANAYGLMQLLLPTAQQMARADGMKKPEAIKGGDLFDPALNVRLGTRFLSELSKGYKDHPAVTIAGYNGGFGNVDRWLSERGGEPLDLWVENMPFGQTRHYTKRVLMSLWIYHWLYAGAEGEALVVPVPLRLPPPSR